jgi:hypothetical protein
MPFVTDRSTPRGVVLMDVIGIGGPSDGSLYIWTSLNDQHSVYTQWLVYRKTGPGKGG